MREQNNIPNEYPESWDDGTYQTGAAQPGKGQSMVITALLAATIFLGGIASALGVMNVRLLRQLVQQESPVLPVAVDSNSPSENFLRENPGQAPVVPQERHLELQVGASGLARAEAVTAQIKAVTDAGEQVSGAALIMSADGYLLTDASLVDNALSIAVHLSDGRVIPGAYVACDHYSDLAVVYVQAEDLTAATFAPSWAGEPREDVVDGPVFDADGRVMGYACRDAESGQSQLVAAPELMDIAKQLVERGLVSGRPDLQLQLAPLSNFCRQYWGLDRGMEVTAALGQAKQAGILAGDILLSVNGETISSHHALCQALLQMQVGEQVILEIFRAGQRFTVTLAVTEIP